VTFNVTPVNDDPVPGTHKFATNEDTDRVISIQNDLLATDRPGPPTATDEANQTLTVQASATSAKGGTIAQSSGQLVYTPPAHLFGTDIDTFTYVLTDSLGASTNVTVTITLNPVNDAPTAVDDPIRTFRDVVLTIPAAQLLGNDSSGPLENDPLRIVSVRPVTGTVGTVELLSDGNVRYTPPAGYDGPDAFEYVMTDGEFESTARVSLTVEPFIPSTVTGMVFADETGDGQRDAAERGIGGVAIRLQGTTLLGAIDLVQYTLADGTYDFGALPPGTFTVSYVTPEQYIDAPDKPGSLGDSDLLLNAYTFTIDLPGGAKAENYDFAMFGLNSKYSNAFDRLAASKSGGDRGLLTEALYGLVGGNNQADWFAATSGYDGIQYAEIVLSGDRKQAVVTLVTEDFRVLTATVGEKRFVVIPTVDGRYAVRILGGITRHNFQEVDLANPPNLPVTGYLDAIERIYAQEGWGDEDE
jgi:hypothetical protein